MSTWEERSKAGQIAYDIFKEEAFWFGFGVVEQTGVEFDNETVQKELRKRDDLTSIIIRHRPDAIGFMETRSVMVQVKGSPNVKTHFPIEVDSWRSAHEWSQRHQQVLMVFVQIPTKKMWFEWACNVRPKAINVPQRFDGEKQFQRMQQEYPDIIIKKMAYSGRGSGTPYFYVSVNQLKEASYCFFDTLAAQYTQERLFG